MQEIIAKKEPKEWFAINDLSSRDKQRLVDVFAWLIQEDKKQNPEFYNKCKKT